MPIKKTFVRLNLWIFKNFQKNFKMSFKTKMVIGEERKNKKAQWHPRLRDCFERGICVKFNKAGRGLVIFIDKFPSFKNSREHKSSDKADEIYRFL
jgi:hypothetical protein